MQLLVPYISSDNYIFYGQNIVHSYAKNMPFSELLTAFYNEVPDVYKRVFFNRKPHFRKVFGFDKVFYSEICFDHQFEACNIPNNQLFWLLVSNSVEDNDRKIDLGRHKQMIMIKHDNLEELSYVKLLKDSSIAINSVRSTTKTSLVFLQYKITAKQLAINFSN